jgi:hypothetical protein
MPRILNKSPRAHDLIPDLATRAPLGDLSCPYSSRDVAGPADEDPRCHDAFRAVGTRDARPEDRSSASCADRRGGHADPWHWRGFLLADYWSPPTSESQYARQRILAVIVAFILATLLAQAGW